MAEREGFEPPIELPLCLISSQVHSTGLCHLSVEGTRCESGRFAPAGPSHCTRIKAPSPVQPGRAGPSGLASPLINLWHPASRRTVTAEPDQRDYDPECH
jgi:hypothetical protein